ncbi:hypothetical protein PG275_09905 [Riemerella anatipestifer]|uniref:hypothetical protein n=1 Tax=Riemerella anatipestifer TaxID=34085 RepID=UPI002A89D1E0|nr:hypothetical protein [Riemerella anatipestifer]
MRNKIINILVIAIAFMDYMLHLNFLVLTNVIYLKILLFSAVISLLLLFLLRIRWQKLIKIFFLVGISGYFIHFSFLYIKAKNYKVFKEIVPLNGYYTRRINGVLFTFRNKNFDRPISKISSKILENDILKKYELELKLVEVGDDVYFISTKNIVLKRN